ncbi:MAG: D-glycero-beta-D-manno-heptose 1-phosphate adenylyltransferase [Deltaproteobacteria bacterium]|nr:MAG: D-glycero-beta-D-manno-heptose 1-phosphate adenylyltransferase [Deltaproteobacteria bacterium]
MIYDSRESLAVIAASIRSACGDKRMVFTNGCFDILHAGHVDYLARARELGDLLVVGLNSDASVRSIKGNQRPVQGERDRAAVLVGLACVDHVVIFNEDTPFALIQAVMPDVLVKGGDWPVETIVGRELVEARGGQVISMPLLPGYSTTGIIDRILAVYHPDTPGGQGGI